MFILGFIPVFVHGGYTTHGAPYLTSDEVSNVRLWH